MKACPAQQSDQRSRKSAKTHDQHVLSDASASHFVTYALNIWHKCDAANSNSPCIYVLSKYVGTILKKLSGNVALRVEHALLPAATS